MNIKLIIDGVPTIIPVKMCYELSLRKALPVNIILTCCQSCRHGNFCPFGDLDNEIFCLKGMNHNDKSDVVDIFLEDHNIRGLRKRKLLDVCIDYEPITDNFYTYNDWHSYK